MTEQIRLRKNTSFNRIRAAATLKRHAFTRVRYIIAPARADHLPTVKRIVDLVDAVDRKHVPAPIEDVIACALQRYHSRRRRAFQAHDIIVADLRNRFDIARRASERIILAEVRHHIIAGIGREEIHLAKLIRARDRVIARARLD